MASPSELPALDDFETLAVVTERIRELDVASARRITEHVAAGGGIAVLTPAWHPLLGKLFARPDVFEAPHRPGLVEDTIVLEGRLLPGAAGLALPAARYSQLDLAADELRGRDGVTILAETVPGLRPVAWTNRYGRGRAVYWNASVLGTTATRGLIAQSLVAAQERTIRPMANWGVVYLDDFPSPASSAELEPVATEFGLGMAEFYATRWYPDMRRLAERFGLTYTSGLVFSYDGSTVPPFRFDEWLAGIVRHGGRAVFYAPWITRLDARSSEIALHGYNHEPLTVENWGSEATMVRALERARWRWETDGLAPLPETYIPPMNVIDSVGVQALTRAFPELRTIAGLHHGPFDQGQGREFGPEPWNEGLYALPRTTSGYILTPGMKLAMLSGLHVVGGWGHFVHPDEVYPNEHRYMAFRSRGIEVPPEGLRWRNHPADDGLYHTFEAWLEFVRDRYPWLRYMQAAEAARTMRRYQETPFTATVDGDVVRIACGSGGLFFTVYSRSGERIAEVAGAEIVHQGRTGLFTYHVLRSEAPQVSLRLTHDR
jgi:hypothetical protein